MQQFKHLGVSLSLDDFGTGYSSLNYLRKYPFDKIKIDQSFIRDRGNEREAKAIIAAIASLGAGLDKIVVAEGIENRRTEKTRDGPGCPRRPGLSVQPADRRGCDPRLSGKVRRRRATGRIRPQR